MRNPNDYMGALCREWNRSGFTPEGKRQRRDTTQRRLRLNSKITRTRGRGNRAWKRVDAIEEALWAA